jgi:V/A-type H+-transporting ATPase subunit D
MAKIALNKSALQKEREQIRLYQRVLPSLDLKRQHLTLELGRAREAITQAREEVDRLSVRIAQQLPMLANTEIEVTGLVQVQSAQVEEENVVGVKVPMLVGVECTVRNYSMLAKPHWVDVLVERLKQSVELRAQVQVAEERVRRLDRAVRRTTQRVNLFDKILIPTAKRNIRRIQIFLGDAERAAIVRAKRAKAKRLREQPAMASQGDAV